jgi:hypothetical protein
VDDGQDWSDLSWRLKNVRPRSRAIYGPDGTDLTVGDAPFNWNRGCALSSLRIGLFETEFDQGFTRTPLKSSASILRAQRDVINRRWPIWRKAGVKMTPIELPKFPTNNIRYILTAEAATAFDDITRDGRVNHAIQAGSF